MTPEGKVKDLIKKFLKSVPECYYHMPVMNGMGAPTLDFVCCYKGRYFVIEAKAPGKRPTAVQIDTMTKILEAGGQTFVVDDEASLQTVRNWMLLEV